MKAMTGYDVKPLKVGAMIIFFIGSFFFPLFFIIFFQDLLFFSRDHIYFQALFGAYLLFFIGMMGMAITLSFDLWYNSRRETVGKRNRPWVFFIGIPIVCVLCLFGVNSYFFFDPQGLHINEPLSIEQTDMNWSDMKEVVKVTTRENNTLKLVEHRFISEDGTSFTVENDQNFFNHRGEIYSHLTKANVPMRTIEVESAH